MSIVPHYIPLFQLLSPHCQDHPGGAAIILKYAGRDATAAYEPIHPADALDKNLSASAHLGPVNTDAASTLDAAVRNRRKTKDEIRIEEAHKYKPALSHVLSLRDMEVSAREGLREERGRGN